MQVNIQKIGCTKLLPSEAGSPSGQHTKRGSTQATLDLLQIVSVFSCTCILMSPKDLQFNSMFVTDYNFAALEGSAECCSA